MSEQPLVPVSSSFIFFLLCRVLNASKYSWIKSSRFIFIFLLVDKEEEDEADDEDEEEEEEEDDLRKFFKFLLHKNNTTRLMTTMTRPMPDIIPASTVVFSLKSLFNRCDGV